MLLLHLLLAWPHSTYTLLSAFLHLLLKSFNSVGRWQEPAFPPRSKEDSEKKTPWPD